MIKKKKIRQIFTIKLSKIILFKNTIYKIQFQRIVIMMTWIFRVILHVTFNAGSFPLGECKLNRLSWGHLHGSVRVSFWDHLKNFHWKWTSSNHTFTLTEPFHLGPVFSWTSSPLDQSILDQFPLRPVAPPPKPSHKTPVNNTPLCNSESRHEDNIHTRSINMHIWQAITVFGLSITCRNRRRST